MKKIVSSLSVIALLLVCLLAAGCQAEPAQSEPSSSDSALTGLWANATYTEDTTLGEGATTLTVIVSAEDKEVTFTVNTDKTTVGAALVEAGIVEDADGDGLFTVVNGMTADYNVDQTYWAFYENDAYAMTGMNDTAITAGVIYKLVQSK